MLMNESHLIVKPSFMPVSENHPAKMRDIFKVKKHGADNRPKAIAEEKKRRRNFFLTAKEKRKAEQKDGQPAAKR